MAVLSTACFGVYQSYADVTGLFRCNVSCMEREGRNSLAAVAVHTTLDTGFAVAEINRADLPAACCCASDKSILLSFLYLERAGIACFKIGCKIAACTLDSKALDRVGVSYNFDYGRISFVSDLKGNLGCARFFYTETNVVVVIGISVRFKSVSEILGSVAPGTIGKRVKFNDTLSTDYFNIRFGNA